jgi:hypothetical protein
MFHPWNVGIEKIRIGNKYGDGGYVIINSNFDSKFILGYGVDKDLSFENEFVEKFGMKAFVFDHTITDVPNISSNVQYFKEGIGTVDAPPLYTLDTHVKKFIPDGETFILKMDVEGCEWDVLKNADLSRVTQLIIEFHEMQEAPLEIISKINENFYLVHIHGNNCHNQPLWQVDRVHNMPRFIECTYVRKDLAPNAVLDYGKFPSELDVKCRDDVPELELNFWRAYSNQISFIAPDDDQVSILKRIITPKDEIVSKKELATHENIFELKTNDIVPINIIFSLENMISQGSLMFNIVTNGFLSSRELRFTTPKTGTFLCNDPIFNFIKKNK